MAKIREFEWDFAHQLVQDWFHSSCWDFTQNVSGAFERWPGPSRVGFVDVVDVSPMDKNMVASWDLHGISRGFCFELVIYQWYEVRKTWMWSVFHGILPWFHGIWMGFFMIYHLDQLAFTEIYMGYTGDRGASSVVDPVIWFGDSTASHVGGLEVIGNGIFFCHRDNI